MQQIIFGFHLTVLFNAKLLEEFDLFAKLLFYLSSSEVAAANGEIIVSVIRSFDCDELIEMVFCFD
jgi:hypothetical protein